MSCFLKAAVYHHAQCYFSNSIFKLDLELLKQVPKTGLKVAQELLTIFVDVSKLVKKTANTSESCIFFHFEAHLLLDELPGQNGMGYKKVCTVSKFQDFQSKSVSFKICLYQFFQKLYSSLTKDTYKTSVSENKHILNELSISASKTIIAVLQISVPDPLGSRYSDLSSTTSVTTRKFPRLKTWNCSHLNAKP